MAFGGGRMKPAMSNAFKRYVADKNLQDYTSKGAAIHAAVDAVLGGDGPQAAADALFECASKVQDENHIGAVAGEIEATLKAADGVLLARIIVKTPNGAGGSVSEYVGLRVVGAGSNKAAAISALEKQRSKRPQSLSTHCTPDDPTGTGSRHQGASMSAGRPGWNMGYEAHISRRLEKVLEKNPRNEQASGVISRVHYEENHIFITAEDWQAIKQNRNKATAWCGGVEAASGSATSGSATSGSGASSGRSVGTGTLP